MLPNDEPLMPLAKAEALPPELLAAMQEKFPGMQIICAGDVPNMALPPGLIADLEELERQHARSLGEGRCLDCDCQMPDYPATGEAMETFKPAEGWTWFTNTATGDIVAWQCPDCDARDQQEDEDGDPDDTELYIPGPEN